jgi:exonuclease VII large subunit
MVIPLTPHVNRAFRREKEQEYDRITQKLDKICVEFEKEISKLDSLQAETNYNFIYEHLFHSYNEEFTDTCDQLNQKAKQHAIHRGYFFMMYAPERIGVMRNEDQKRNTIRKIISTPLEHNIAAMLS